MFNSNAGLGERHIFLVMIPASHRLSTPKGFSFRD